MTKKRKREQQPRPTIHPKNKYSEKSPDFALLASQYPSFEPFVSYSRDGRPRIDWTDFNATRELTRVLLLHDHGINWWIPDGQLCPTVPNRSNYIHWLEDLLSSDIIPNPNNDSDKVIGFDIGTGANCIYPLLGASLLGWRFVGSDVTDVALEWAERNVGSNPQISELIEIRKAGMDSVSTPVEGSSTSNIYGGGNEVDLHDIDGQQGIIAPLLPLDPTVMEKSYSGPPILYGVVKEGETFDFCMCNPPFFESMESAGLNPKTACGGTQEEMVCPGGEQAFICRIIEDSVRLQQAFRWYTSMVGRKANLKSLISKLREVGVTIVKTTEFVQGQTCRWGIAWSFIPPVKKVLSTHVAGKTNPSFMLEGLQRQIGAFKVLQSVESFFSLCGASCKLNPSSFVVDVTASNDQLNAILMDSDSRKHLEETTGLSFRISVFQQIPGTLLIKGSLQLKDSQSSGAFSSAFQRLEDALRDEFCRAKPSIGPSLPFPCFDLTRLNQR